MENILEVKNLCKSFPGFTLDDVSFDLPAGYIMGFIGPNGAGKTTTIRLIMDLIHKDSGEVLIFGQDHIRQQKKVRDNIGFVYDESHFYEELNVMQIRRILAPFYSRWDEPAFQGYLHRFNIPSKPKFKSLSRGEKMKFALAMALSHQAQLIIMDEPTSGLDPVFRNELLEILADLMQDENKAVLFSTHITADLQKIADYVCFINHGQIVFTRDIDTVLNQYQVVKGPLDLLDQDSRRLLTGLREHAYGFEALCSQAQELEKRLGSRLVTERASLDDIMLYMVRGDSHV